MKIRILEKLIEELNNRLETLEKYRKMDLDKEILHILNERNKYRQQLVKLKKKGE